MRWLSVRLRARRINNKRLSRLREMFIDNHYDEDRADYMARLEIERRRITAQDIKIVREAKRLGLDWKVISETLADTRTYRILGWE